MHQTVALMYDLNIVKYAYTFFFFIVIQNITKRVFYASESLSKKYHICMTNKIPSPQRVVTSYRDYS